MIERARKVAADGSTATTQELLHAILVVLLALHDRPAADPPKRGVR